MFIFNTQISHGYSSIRRIQNIKFHYYELFKRSSYIINSSKDIVIVNLQKIHLRCELFKRSSYIIEKSSYVIKSSRNLVTLLSLQEI